VIQTDAMDSIEAVEPNSETVVTETGEAPEVAAEEKKSLRQEFVTLFKLSEVRQLNLHNKCCNFNLISTNHNARNSS